jgi:DNA repair protein SbcD/Mre11
MPQTASLRSVAMRLLHTSDWHLGRRFHDEDLIDAQRAFLDHLRDTARDEKVNAILVAGDIYDRAIPSLDAVRLLDEALHQLAGLNLPIIMISGNHDSAHRLGTHSRLLARAGIHLRTTPAASSTPVLLDDQHGTVAIYGIPYLEPSLARADLEADRTSHHAVIAAAMNRVCTDLATYPASTRSVVLAHAFVTGANTCESERDITVGGVPHVPASVFKDIDYVALGHLHGAQSVNSHVHYSGSPLAYSFSETNHTKSLTLVDLPADGTPRLTRVPTPVPRHLARLSGTLQELLTSTDHVHLVHSWVEATLTDTALPYEAMAQLQRRFPHTVSLRHRPAAAADDSNSLTYTERLRGRSPLDISCDFITSVRGTAPTPAEHDLLRQAVEASRVRSMERETL